MDVGQVISEVADLAYDAQTPTIIYAATEGSGMLRSTDGGTTWAPMGEGIQALGWVRSIAAEPSPPYRVFASTEADGLYVSEDHGLWWAKADASPEGFVINQILCTDDKPSLLYLATSDGLWRSRDGAQTWAGWERAAGSLGHVPVYSLAQVATDDRIILYAGTTGGYVESTEALALASNGDTLVNAGVYRYTTRRNPRFCLPLVLKRYLQ